MKSKRLCRHLNLVYFYYRQKTTVFVSIAVYFFAVVVYVFWSNVLDMVRVMTLIAFFFCELCFTQIVLMTHEIIY